MLIEKVKPYWEKIKTSFGKIPKKMLMIGAVVLVLAAAVLTYALNNKPYDVLFTELNTEEASAIMAYLDQQGMTDYRLENNNTIMVPKDQKNKLTAQLIMNGYPKSGFAYSAYYDHVNALSTESERDRAFLIGVQDWMGAVIRCLDGVSDARVGINPGEDRSYVLDSGNMVDASATVMVTMKGGQTLSKQQANAIRNLVAHGVRGLKIESVAITDSMGNVYSGSMDGSEATNEASQLKLALEEEYNNRVRTAVMQNLIPFFGEDNVRVSVNTTVDVNRSIENATNVYLPEWANDGSTGGQGIIGSKVWDDSITRGGDEAANGVPGTSSNADLPTYIEGITPDGTEQQISTSGQIDYDNPRSETQTERVAGYISDCMVSVSINSTTAGTVDVDTIRAHVARAAGISDEMSESKISVLPMPFYAPDAPVPEVNGKPIPMWAIYAAAGGLLLFLILLIVILVLRKRRRKRAMESQIPVQQIMVPAAEPVGADVMTMQSEKSMELRKDVRKFADDNPEIAAQMVKSWLRGGEEDG